MARHQDSRSSGQAIHQAVALRIAPNIAKLPELSNKPDRGEMCRVVEQYITNTAAEDDAERGPNDEVVDVGYAERGRAAPQLLRRNNCACIKPAADNADDIGERIPAHSKGAD